MFFIKSRFQKKYYTKLTDYIKDNIIHLKKIYNHFPWDKINYFEKMIDSDSFEDIEIDSKKYSFNEAIKFLSDSRDELSTKLNTGKYISDIRPFLNETNDLSSYEEVFEVYEKYHSNLETEFSDMKKVLYNCTLCLKNINAKYKQYRKTNN